MSLINDALKKAQRSRGPDPGDLAPLVPGRGGIAKRQPLSAKSILLYASGALVLFVLAVVATVYVLNRPTTSRPVGAQKSIIPTIASPDSGGPLIVPPVVISSGASAPQPAAPGSATTTPSPVATATATPTGTAPPPAQVATGAEPSTPVTTAAKPVSPPPPPMPDERIHVYLDTLRVTAVRLQEGESRVMVNERIFRVNDIVERNLSLRLTKVESSQLTFTDANGVTYVKYF